MSIENLTARERQIYHCGYKEGKRDGMSVVVYMAIGFVLMFICFLSNVLKW